MTDDRTDRIEQGTRTDTPEDEHDQLRAAREQAFALAVLVDELRTQLLTETARANRNARIDWPLAWLAVTSTLFALSAITLLAGVL